MMSTFCSKHVEAWNKHIEKECIKLVINQNYVEMHGQQNIKFLVLPFHCVTAFIIPDYFHFIPNSILLI